MKLRPYLLFFVIFISYSLNSFAQTEELIKIEDELVALYNDLLLAEDNQTREGFNTQFYEVLENALLLDESFDYPFDKLLTISKMLSSDKALRVFTWNLQNNEGINDFFGIIQLNPKNTRGHIQKVIPLLNQKGELIKAENKSFNPNQWPGAVYYQIISIKKGKQNYYVLPGWRGIDNGLTQKVIEVIHLNGDNVKFGYPVLKNDKKMQRRFVFSYNAKATMHLAFDEKKEQFVFDHLAPSSNLVQGQYRFYGPDGSYDALKFEKKNWEYIPNIDAKNQEKDSDLFYTPAGKPEIEE